MRNMFWPRGYRGQMLLTLGNLREIALSTQILSTCSKNETFENLTPCCLRVFSVHYFANVVKANVVKMVLDRALFALDFSKQKTSFNNLLPSESCPWPICCPHPSSAIVLSVKM